MLPILLLADQLVSELYPSFRCFVQASVELTLKFISDLLKFSSIDLRKLYFSQRLVH